MMGAIRRLGSEVYAFDELALQEMADARVRFADDGGDTDRLRAIRSAWRVVEEAAIDLGRRAGLGMPRSFRSLGSTLGRIGRITADQHRRLDVLRDVVTAIDNAEEPFLDGETTARYVVLADVLASEFGEEPSQ